VVDPGRSCIDNARLHVRAGDQTCLILTKFTEKYINTYNIK
jgi:hypothetical protein